MTFSLNGNTRHTERAAPYDFIGGRVATAAAFNTLSVADGQYTLEMIAVNMSNQIIGKGSAAFIVANTNDNPPPRNDDTPTPSLTVAMLADLTCNASQYPQFDGANWLCMDAVVAVQGPPGEQGLPGPTGIVGAQGLPGPQGEQGLQGIPGMAGIQGPRGLTGSIGPQGPAGNDGADGAQGPAGNDGVEGPQGDTGLSGAIGAQGEAGAKGDPGNPGASGDFGALYTYHVEESSIVEIENGAGTLLTATCSPGDILTGGSCGLQSGLTSGHRLYWTQADTMSHQYSCAAQCVGEFGDRGDTSAHCTPTNVLIARAVCLSED